MAFDVCFIERDICSRASAPGLALVFVLALRSPGRAKHDSNKDFSNYSRLPKTHKYETADLR